jgi:hypothetical protein
MTRKAEGLPGAAILMQTNPKLAFCTEIGAYNQVFLYEPVSPD